MWAVREEVGTSACRPAGQQGGTLAPAARPHSPPHLAPCPAYHQVFGHSPDETAFARIQLNREATGDSMLMIQPTLYSFAFAGPPEPVLLDVSSIAPDRILLLDAYFYVVVFHGSTVAQWRKAGYQDQPEHAAFKQLLAAPQDEAHAIIQRRFPTPRFTDCDQNGAWAGRDGCGWVVGSTATAGSRAAVRAALPPLQQATPACAPQEGYGIAVLLACLTGALFAPLLPTSCCLQGARRASCWPS